MRKSKGVTLIELIIVIVILGIIASFSGSILSRIILANDQGQVQALADQQARIAFGRMSRDIRLIRSDTAANFTFSSTSISFFKSNGSAERFALNGTDLELRQSTTATALSDLDSVTPQVLAQDISSLTFTYYDVDGVVTADVTAIRTIKIAMTLSNSKVTRSFQDLIMPRNFI